MSLAGFLTVFTTSPTRVLTPLSDDDGMNKFTIAGIAFTSGLSTLAVAPMSSALASPLAQSTTSECGVPSTSYGEMFPDLAGASWAVDDLRALSEAMIAPADEPTSGVDPEDNRDRKSTRLNSSHVSESRMPSSA